MPKGHYTRKLRHYPLDSNLPIDAAATLKRLGYAATSVSPGSTKKVSCRCTRCDVVFDRMRRRITPDTLCASCAHTKGGVPAKFPRKSGYEKVMTKCSVCTESLAVRRMSMHTNVKCPRCKRRTAPKINKYVDSKETERRFGYVAESVPAKSFKRVVVCCAACNQLFERIRRNVRSRPVCAACARGNSPEANVYIDDDQTLQRFGYRGTALARKSNRIVIARCASCGASFERCRVSVTTRPQCRTCQYPPVDHPQIDTCETKRRFGYEVKTLTRTSTKRVVVRCATCHVLFERAVVSLRTPAKCRACQYPVKHHPALDDVETMRRFGYKASEVPSKSARRVVGHCVKCGALFERARHNVSDAPVCRPCTYFVPPMSNCYGRAESTLRERLEGRIERSLETQLRLSNGQFVDIYDPRTRIGIEYCGLFWHNERSPSPRGRTYHWDKYQVCKADGVQLITVFEDEWNERTDIVLDVLSAQMGVYEHKLGARQCRVRQLDVGDALAFFRRYHVQGAPPGGWFAQGLYDVKDGLVAAMLFGPHHRQGHAQTVVLSRFCYKSGAQVIGGAKRLLKAAHKSIIARDCVRLISWSDNRWFSGRVYTQLGFTLEQELPPDYTYVLATKPTRRLSKQSQRKRVTGCPSDMTEHQWALKRGLARVWDCGRRRWTMSLEETNDRR
jgi:phage FluMu protein Com